MAWIGTRFSIRRCCACDEQAPQGCTLLNDPFDTDLNNFTEVSGTWNVAGGLLTGSGGTLLANNKPDLATDGIHISTSAQIDSGDPATLRLIGAYDDANNYVFGELARAGSGGTIRVGQVVGGATTWLSEEITLEDDTEIEDLHALEFCWQPPRPQPQLNLVAVHVANNGAGSPGAAWNNYGNCFGESDSVFNQGNFVTANPLPCTYSGFGIAIPQGSTVNGISVGIICTAGESDPANEVRLTSLRLIGSSGTPSGDDKGANQVVSTAGTTTVGGGGPTDNWAAGLTADDFNSGDFTVAATWDCTDPTPTFLDVVQIDACIVTIWYTTPDKTSGVVTLTYTNSEPGAIVPTQCAIGLTTYEAPGKSAGIILTAGSWDFTHFTLSYLDSPTHTPCPTCECVVACFCCSDTDPASQTYIVDLPVGMFDDGTCGNADLIIGEYLLEWNHFADGHCGWDYEEELPCGAIFKLQLFLGWIVGTNACFMSLAIRVTDGAEYASIGYFDSGIGALGTIQCQDGAPFVLGAGVFGSSASPPVIQGSLPPSLDIELP